MTIILRGTIDGAWTPGDEGVLVCIRGHRGQPLAWVEVDTYGDDANVDVEERAFVQLVVNPWKAAWPEGRSPDTTPVSLSSSQIAAVVDAATAELVAQVDSLADTVANLTNGSVGSDVTTAERVEPD